MKFHEAYAETLHRFHIKQSAIAQSSGVSESLLSQFRHGKNITVATLEAILTALPPDARAFLLECVREESSG